MYEECIDANKFNKRDCKFINSKMDIVGLDPVKKRVLFWKDWNQNVNYRNKGFEARLAFLLTKSSLNPITRDSLKAGVQDGSNVAPAPEPVDESKITSKVARAAMGLTDSGVANGDG